jgi:hypothetical protein
MADRSWRWYLLGNDLERVQNFIRSKHYQYRHQLPAHTDNPAPTAQEIPKHDTPHADQGSSKRHADKAVPNKVEQGMVRWTRVVGVFTGVLAVVGFVQAWAFIQSERAFVSVASMSYHAPVAPEKIAVFDLQIRNSGRSTANIKHNIYTVSYSIGGTPNYPGETEVSLSPVVPGGFIQFQIKTPTLADDAFNALGGQSQFFIYGRIDYEDDFSIFGLKKSGWCFVFDPKGNPAVSQFNSCNNSKYTYSR